MKVLVGLLVILGGVALGVYVGGYLLFIGGIIQVVTACTAAEVSAVAVVWGVAKVLSATFVGSLSAFVVTVLGLGIMGGK